MIANTTVSDYLFSLGSNSATPGGGAAACVAGAQGAALVAMVCRLTREQSDSVTRILSAADKARDKFIQLADDDIQCFDEVMNAYKLRAASAEEKAKKNQTIQQALKEAASVPARMIDETIALIPLTAELVEEGNRNLITDVGIAASLFECVLTSSKLNILVNIKHINDAQFISRFDDKLASSVEMIERTQDINNRVETILKHT
ncbi:MAG: cyclodeaminase/cyclohydrolase family protein [Pseudomonadales bacterium]